MGSKNGGNTKIKKSERKAQKQWGCAGVRTSSNVSTDRAKKSAKKNWGKKERKGGG